jgi:hypothetical protein
MEPTSPRPRSDRVVPPPNHDPGWQALYLASEISRGIDEYRNDYYDYVIGFVRPSGEEFSAPLDVLQFFTSELKADINNLRRLLSREVIGQAFASEEEGLIARIASGVVEVYARMIAWGNRQRNAVVPDAWRAAFSAHSRLVSTPLRQIQDFAKEYLSAAEEVVLAIREGGAPPQMRMRMSPAFRLDPQAVEEWKQALERWKAGRP